MKHPETDRRVSGLLKALELEPHAPAFEEAGVRLEHLPTLGARELAALGLTREEDRARLLEAAAALRHLPPPATPHRVGQVPPARAEARLPSIHTAVRPRGGDVPATPRTPPAPGGVPWLGLSIAGLLVGAGVLAALWVPGLVEGEVAVPPQERSPEALNAGPVIPPAPAGSPASTAAPARGPAKAQSDTPSAPPPAAPPAEPAELPDPPPAAEPVAEAKLPDPPLGGPETTDLTRLATVRVSSTLPSDVGLTFGADNLVDGRLETTWQPNAKRTRGAGQWIEFRFSKPQVISRIDLANGFQGDFRGEDMFLPNGRARDVLVELGPHKLPFTLDVARRGYNAVPISPSVMADRVTIRVVSVEAGTRWPDLAIGDVRIVGYAEE